VTQCCVGHPLTGVELSSWKVELLKNNNRHSS
jgi:hypothetical protein